MYQESIVFFADILGFSELVKSSTDKEINEILNYFGMPFQSTFLDEIAHNTSDKFSIDEIPSKFEELKKENNELDDMVNIYDKANGKRKCTIFSDNVLVSYDVDRVEDKEKTSILIKEIERIFEILKLLVQRDILFRGGLVLGSLFHGEKTVFGPALINAYNIESKFSIFPRICVDENIVQLLKKLNNNKFNILLTEDFDGMYFIDYLKIELIDWILFNEKYGQDKHNDESLDSFLLDHSNYIQGNFEYAHVKNYYTKIAWQKNYHNRTIRKYGVNLKEYNLDINKYLIKDKEV